MEGLVQGNKLDIINMEREFIDFVDVTEKTINTYINGIDSFKGYIDSKDISSPTRKDIIEWRNKLIKENSCSTANTYLVGVKAFFNFLEMCKAYPNITKNVKGAKVSSYPKKNILTLEQIKTIHNGLTDIREKALFDLLITTGLRGTEVANAKIEDIREFNGEICLFVKCKGHQEYDEYVKLSDEVLKDILEYIGDRRKGNIFISTSNNNKNGGVSIKTIRLIIKNIFKRFGITDETISLHSTRRSFACLSYKLGKSIYDIQAVLHHKSIQTTARYLQQADRSNNNSEKLVSDIICE